MNFRGIIFKPILTLDGWGIAYEIALKSMAKNSYWSTLVNIGSGNGLVLPGNKPFPEPMLTQIYSYGTRDIKEWEIRLKRRVRMTMTTMLNDIHT